MGAGRISPSASLPQAMLYVGSSRRVVEVPMDMCGVYRNNCESCLLARDPYCGWADGRCQSIYHNRYVARAARCYPHQIRLDVLAWEMPTSSLYPFLAAWFCDHLAIRGRSHCGQAVLSADLLPCASAGLSCSTSAVVEGEINGFHTS